MHGIIIPRSVQAKHKFKCKQRKIAIFTFSFIFVSSDLCVYVLHEITIGMTMWGVRRVRFRPGCFELWNPSRGWVRSDNLRGGASNPLGTTKLISSESCGHRYLSFASSFSIFVSSFGPWATYTCLTNPPARTPGHDEPFKAHTQLSSPFS